MKTWKRSNKSRVNLFMVQFCRLSKRPSSWTSNVKSRLSCQREPNRFWPASSSKSCVFSKLKANQCWSQSKSSTIQMVTTSMKLLSNSTAPLQAPNQNQSWPWSSRSTVLLVKRSRVVIILIASLIPRLIKWVSILRGMMTMKSSKITPLESIKVRSLSVKSSLKATSLTAILQTKTKTKTQMLPNPGMTWPRLRT